MTRQTLRHAFGASCLLIASQLVAACPNSTDAGPLMVSTAVTAAGTGVIATGGVSAPAGVGGTVLGAAGGLGVAGAGAAGATVAVAGATGATGAAGAAGAAAGAGGSAAAGTTWTSCAGADTTTPAATLAAKAAALLVVQDPMILSPCAFSSCHGAGAKKAMLILDGSTAKDLHTLMVDKASCESPTLKLVASGGGDAALAKSWLWQKLTAPAAAAGGTLTTNPAWGTPTNCGQMAGQAFGVRMPASGDDSLLGAADPTKLNTIRSWICAGAM